MPAMTTPCPHALLAILITITCLSHCMHAVACGSGGIASYADLATLNALTSCAVFNAPLSISLPTVTSYTAYNLSYVSTVNGTLSLTFGSSNSAPYSLHFQFSTLAAVFGNLAIVINGHAENLTFNALSYVSGSISVVSNGVLMAMSFLGATPLVIGGSLQVSSSASQTSSIGTVSVAQLGSVVGDVSISAQSGPISGVTIVGSNLTVSGTLRVSTSVFANSNIGPVTVSGINSLGAISVGTGLNNIGNVQISGPSFSVTGSITLQTASNSGAITSVAISGLSSVGSDLDIHSHAGAIGPVTINNQTTSCATTSLAVAGNVIIQTNVRFNL